MNDHSLKDAMGVLEKSGIGGYGQISPTDPSLALIYPCVRYKQIMFHNSSSPTSYRQSMEAGVSSA